MNAESILGKGLVNQLCVKHSRERSQQSSAERAMHSIKRASKQALRDYHRKTSTQTQLLDEDEVELDISEDELMAMGLMRETTNQNENQECSMSSTGSMSFNQRRSDSVKLRLLAAKNAANYDKRRKTQMQAFLNRVKVRQNHLTEMRQLFQKNDKYREKANASQAKSEKKELKKLPNSKLANQLTVPKITFADKLIGNQFLTHSKVPLVHKDMFPPPKKTFKTKNINYNQASVGSQVQQQPAQ